MPTNSEQIKNAFIATTPHKVEITELIRQGIITNETMRDYMIVLYLKNQNKSGGFPSAVKKAAEYYGISERWVRKIYDNNQKFDRLI